MENWLESKDRSANDDRAEWLAQRRSAACLSYKVNRTFGDEQGSMFETHVSLWTWLLTDADEIPYFLDYVSEHGGQNLWACIKEINRSALCWGISTVPSVLEQRAHPAVKSSFVRPQPAVGPPDNRSAPWRSLHPETATCSPSGPTPSITSADCKA